MSIEKDDRVEFPSYDRGMIAGTVRSVYDDHKNRVLLIRPDAEDYPAPVDDRSVFRLERVCNKLTRQQ